MNIRDFHYTLPEEKIANYPLARRDEAKLLVYRQGSIAHSAFRSLADLLPEQSFLFFNDTKVIPARLHFVKETGAAIEIFLLHPELPSPELAGTMGARGSCRWKCAIGNLKRWTAGQQLVKQLGDLSLSASLVSRETGSVTFRWNGDASFAEVLQAAGETPLPPYIRRKPEVSDSTRYQTIYSHYEGAVAAPTAGLHFTPGVFADLERRKVQHDFLTLHVSAGTFQPIKTQDPGEHRMHQEQIVITRQNLQHLLAGEKRIVAVGTTSLRTLESIYWFGAKLLHDANASFNITQEDAYALSSPPPVPDAVGAILARMDRDKTDSLTGETAIYITPGYVFRVCRGLITNFHQPASTLILLVAAFVGEDWRRIYDEALRHDYRFLSYGDSSLLLP